MGGSPLSEVRRHKLHLALKEHGPVTSPALALLLEWPRGTVRAGVNLLRHEGLAEVVGRDLETGAKEWAATERAA